MAAGRFYPKNRWNPESPTPRGANRATRLARYELFGIRCTKVTAYFACQKLVDFLMSRDGRAPVLRGIVPPGMSTALT